MAAISQREHLQNTHGKKCPNCAEWMHEADEECYECGYDGLCVTCRTVTDFAGSPDLRYCSEDCYRQDAEHERRFDR